MSRVRRSWRVSAALLVILSAAAILRVWGMDYGLPHPLNRPDEEHIVGRAFHIVATGDPFPGSFDWPHLLIYLDTLVLATYYTVGKIAGSYDRVMDFLFEAVVLNPGLHYRICRVVGVVFGVATVAVTYLVGRRAYGSRAALLASAALATCYLHVRDSRFATPDVPMTFFVALSLLFAILAVEKPSVTRFVLSGVFAGLATSTKYHAGLVVLSVAAAGWAAWRRPEGNLTVRAVTLRLLVAGVGFSLAFALSSPYAVLRYPALVRALGGLTGLHYRPEGTSALWEHISVTLPYGLGWPFFLAAMAGVVRALWLRRAADWVLLAFCLSFFGFISALTSVFPRYVVPLTPLFALFAADFVDGLLKAVKRGRSLLYAAAAIALIGPGLWASVQFDRLAARKDTRLLASEWVAENVAPQSEILLCEGYGAPHINKDRRRPPAFRPTAVTCEVDFVARASAPYLVTHDHPKVIFSRVREPVSAWLEEKAELLAVFDPFRSPDVSSAYFYRADAFYLPLTGLGVMERGGPIVRIWRLPAR